MNKYNCLLFEPKCPCGDLERDYHNSITYQRPDYSIKDDVLRRKAFDEERALIEEEYHRRRKELEEIYCPGCGWEKSEDIHRRGKAELEGDTLTNLQAVYCLENYKGHSCERCIFKDKECKHDEAVKRAVVFLRMADEMETEEVLE